MTLDYYFLPLAVIVLFFVNRFTYLLCAQRDIPEEQQPAVFRTINVLTTMLLISSYLEVLFT